MTQQFLRALNLVVSDASTGIDLSQLHVKFSIKQWDLQTPNTCQIRVYNVADATARQVQAQFTKILLNAGYQGGDLGTIFQGTLVQARKGRESPVDTYLDLSGMDGDEALNFGIVNTAVAAGSSFQQRATALAQAMNVPLGNVPSTLPSTTLPRGKTMVGMARDQCRDIAFATDTTFFITNGVLHFIPRLGSLNGQAIELNSATGMIGFPEQTENGIQVRTLLNTQLAPGVPVKINNADIQQAQLGLSYTSAPNNALLPSIVDDGMYRVVACEHSGDTRGNEWYSDIICIALNQGVTPGLISRGYSG